MKWKTWAVYKHHTLKRDITYIYAYSFMSSESDTTWINVFHIEKIQLLLL